MVRKDEALMHYEVHSTFSSWFLILCPCNPEVKTLSFTEEAQHWFGTCSSDKPAHIHEMFGSASLIKY